MMGRGVKDMSVTLRSSSLGSPATSSPHLSSSTIRVNCCMGDRGREPDGSSPRDCCTW